MNTKNIFAFLIFAVSGLFFYSFVWDFKIRYVDNVSEELSKLQIAYENATQQLSLKSLRLKKQGLSDTQLNLLQNFVPQNLRTGYFVYNLGQMANQNRLTLKTIQYTVIEDTQNTKSGEKKLLVEISLDGRYEDFNNWLQLVESSNVLIDVESVRGSKINNLSDTLTFYVRLHTYGINID